MTSKFTIRRLQLLRAGPRALAAATVSLLLLIMLSAPLFAEHGGEDRGRSDRSEREDSSGSDRDREDRDVDRSYDTDRDIADRDDSSGPGSDDRNDDSDRSDRDNDRSGSGSSGSGPDDDDSDSSGSGKYGSKDGDDASGSSQDRDTVVRSDDQAPYAIWRNERGDRIRSGEVIFMSMRRDGAARVRDAGLRVIEEQRLNAIHARMMRIAVPEGRSEEDVIASLHSIDPKGTATFNHIYEPAGRPALPVVLTAAKIVRVKPTKAKIGLVDAGVAADHQMLAQVKITQRQFGEGSKSSAQHGTAVASRLATAAPGANIVAANVFTEMRDGQEIASAYAIARALDWLSRQKVAVINLSLAGPANPVLEEIAKRMVDSGHVLVAAVGNEGPRGAAQYPAAYDKVIGVTAVDSGNRVYIYANQGDAVDFAAMGVDAPAATATASVENVSGTSYAAPIVAAAFARRLLKPNPKQALAVFKALRRQARDLGAPGRDPVYGHGLIDIAR
ncbi:MAG: S8 family serine peptidase [Alphaproteobacteria bacterium]|nr:S8 family serine peptidase [Alphaproteobacteria bacterium]